MCESHVLLGTPGELGIRFPRHGRNRWHAKLFKEPREFGLRDSEPAADLVSGETHPSCRPTGEGDGDSERYPILDRLPVHLRNFASFNRCQPIAILNRLDVRLLGELLALSIAPTTLATRRFGFVRFRPHRSPSLVLAFCPARLEYCRYRHLVYTLCRPIGYSVPFLCRHSRNIACFDSRPGTQSPAWRLRNLSSRVLRRTRKRSRIVVCSSGR